MSILDLFPFFILLDKYLFIFTCLFIILIFSKIQKDIKSKVNTFYFGLCILSILSNSTFVYKNIEKRLCEMYSVQSGSFDILRKDGKSFVLKIVRENKNQFENVYDENGKLLRASRKTDNLYVEILKEEDIWSFIKPSHFLESSLESKRSKVKKEIDSFLNYEI